MYGFQKITSKKNPDRNSYFHELFLRGRPGLSRGILRQRHKSLKDPNNEPRLNMFPPMPPSFDTLNVVNQTAANGSDHISAESSRPRAVQYIVPPGHSGSVKAILCAPHANMGVFNGDMDVNHSSSESRLHGEVSRS